jgi:Zn-dependent protease
VATNQRCAPVFRRRVQLAGGNVAVLHLETPKFSYADGSFEIGRFARAPIRVHAGFGLAVAVLTLPYWLTGRLSAVVLVGIGIITVFASVFLHELAHAYVGDRYGVAARRIDLNLFGGVVEFRNPPHTMWQDFAILIAGPLSNLALAAFAYTLATLIGGVHLKMIALGGQFVPDGLHEPGVLARALTFALYLNLGLFVVNMLPAFPLDGGKLVFMLIARRGNGRIATLVIGCLGVVLAIASSLVLLATAMTGWPIWSPPGFTANWEAIQAARRGATYTY